jgi:Glucodextranase, domain B/Carboxypeptidase regulatory-like domain
MLRNNAIQFCRVVLALGALLTVGTTLARAGTFTAFGPQDYTRGTGDPITVTNTFSVPNPNTQYTLKAFNGGLQDSATELVSSGYVIVNGVQVLGPSNFNQNVAEIDVPVTLQALNTVSVEVRGQPGGMLTIQIIGVDNDPPTISATVSPAPNAAGWNNTNATVTFTCNDATSGVAVCPTPVTVSTEGAGQIITGQAVDRAGNTASASVTVNLDLTPPLISAIASPTPNGGRWNNSNVSVTFSCNDTVSGISVCPSPVTVSGEGAGQIVSGQAVDIAGNTASASITVNIDKTPPSIAASISPAPNAAGWNKSNVAVSFACSDSSSGIAVCPQPQTVSSEGAGQVISGAATDRAGNTATASITVNLDKTPPKVNIASPSNGSTISLSTVSIGLSGNQSDDLSGVAAVTCNGSPAAIVGSNFTCTVLLTQGPNSISVQATDVAGNTSSSPLALTYAPAPQLTITAPGNLSVTNITVATVTGTVSDPSAVVSVNGVQAPQSGGTFAISVPLNEGLNVLTAVATNSGGVASTATVQVTLDTTPPHVTIDTPSDGTVTTDTNVTVTGLANDVVVGTVNAQDVQVTVNGVAAQVANRTYAAAAVPLTLGNNTIQAIARDRAGNATTTTVQVTRVLPSQPPPPAIGQAVITQSLSIVSGNNQTGTIGTQLTAPLVVALADSASHPVANRMVVFKVTGSDGAVSPDGTTSPSAAAAVNTDSSGRAQIFWTLGQRSGAGINRVEASSALAVSLVNFTASGVTANASAIVVDSGNDQIGVLGQPLPFPFVVAVVDSGHNRVPNIPVTFTIKNGDGNLSGNQSQTVQTDSNGRAIAVLTLGTQAGNDNNVVEANFPNNSGLPAAFAASARQPANPANTTISGVVLDNSNNPISGATIRLFQTNQGNTNNLPVQVGTPIQTDAKGTFLITNAPVGSFKLMADGTTASSPNSYPTLEYDIVTIAGNNNTLGMPIYLPALDTVNKLCVDETHGGTLTLPQVPGFALTVLPGSATFPGGSRQGCISVTPVNGDKVPMSPGFGQQPRFIVTIQPVGTTFNPPAPITLPNVDGLASKAVTEMYSYDHDLGMFVAIGTGTVSADGSVIVSNPGVGVLKAGWHCGGNPAANGTVADCPTCQFCQNNSCVLDPAQDLKACQTASVSKGVCRNAQCIPVDVKIDASAVNQDDPTNTSYTTLPVGSPVYAGSESSTSDSLQLTATLPANAPPAVTYTWSVSGPGSSAYTPPSPSPSASTWNVGKIMSSPGTLTFQVAVDFGGGTQAQDSRDVEVGVRSDDTIVVGWINPAGVTIPGGASPAVTGLLTPPPVPSSLKCNLFVLDLSENFTSPNFITLTPADRSYVLNWLFKFAGNTDPSTVIAGGDFRNSATSFTDDNKVSTFLADPTNFKLFNRFQVKFRVSGGTFNGSPTVLRQQTGIGTTHNPCGTVLGFLGLFPGQSGPANGPPQVTSPGNDRVSLINDGSPDSGAIRAFDTLTGKDLPAGTTAVFWENIGTRIGFTASGGPTASVVVQPYPTYYEYHNGTLVKTTPQAATPLGNFLTNPYPFGTVSCLGLGGLTPGGRCGDASSPADSSARVPTFTLP